MQKKTIRNNEKWNQRFMFLLINLYLLVNDTSAVQTAIDVMAIIY